MAARWRNPRRLTALIKIYCISLISGSCQILIKQLCFPELGYFKTWQILSPNKIVHENYLLSMLVNSYTDLQNPTKVCDHGYKKCSPLPFLGQTLKGGWKKIIKRIIFTDLDPIKNNYTSLTFMVCNIIWSYL